MKGFITTTRDRENLEFLVTCDSATLDDWFAHTGTADLDYAWELLAAYSRELDEEARELAAEAELVSSDLAAAHTVILSVSQ